MCNCTSESIWQHTHPDHGVGGMALFEVTAGGGQELNIFLSQYSERGTSAGGGKELRGKRHPLQVYILNRV